MLSIYEKQKTIDIIQESTSDDDEIVRENNISVYQQAHTRTQQEQVTLTNALMM